MYITRQRLEDAKWSQLFEYVKKLIWLNYAYMSLYQKRSELIWNILFDVCSRTKYYMLKIKCLSKYSTTEINSYKSILEYSNNNLYILTASFYRGSKPFTKSAICHLLRNLKKKKLYKSLKLCMMNMI